jgi:transcriptional regulator with XRE-family HTH domain
MENIFDKSLLGLNIKHLRKVKGINQRALGDVIGANLTAISNWEVGISAPDIEHLIRLSNYFGISMDNMVKTNYKDWNDGGGKGDNMERLLRRFEELETRIADIERIKTGNEKSISKTA